jgi:hypothetical protein
MPRLGLSVAAVLLGGCALLPPKPPPATPLLPPSALGGERTAIQVVHAAMGEREMSLQCEVHVDTRAATIVALGPLGRRAFSLKYDGDVLDAQLDPYAPAGLPAQRVLADVQLALWPLHAWQERLRGGDWQIAEPRPGLRRLRYRGRLIEEVHYSGSDPWTSPLWLVNLALGYTLEIEPQTP